MLEISIGFAFSNQGYATQTQLNIKMMMMSWTPIFVILIISLNSLVSCQTVRGARLSLFRDLLNNLLNGGSGQTLEDLSDYILLNVIPILFEQKPMDADGRFEQNRDYFFTDTSNDAIAQSSIDEIVKRSGFEVEKHEVTSVDGYITIIYHLINPMADQTKLKQPPVMVMHGGSNDPSSYIFASSIQHHPEKYPRTAEDEPITSWNRSLGFTLANNGYDVWLVATRGSNKENQGRVAGSAIGSGLFGGNSSSLTLAGVELKAICKYWHFSFDELIEFEFPKQLDKILELTGAKNVSLFAYSFSAQITLPLLGTRPDIAKDKIHNYIVMAPILNIDISNTFVRFACKVIPFVPVDLGTLLYTRLVTSQFTRDLLVALNKSRRIRYSMIKLLEALFFGSSGKYRTLLEPPVIGHMFLPLGFQELQHACQIANARRYQKYDYGAIGNTLAYGRTKPPAYDISDIHVKNWMLISGENDNLGTRTSVKQILQEVNPKPLKQVRVAGSSHADLIAGFDNDVQVNLPVVEFLDQFAI